MNAYFISKLLDQGVNVPINFTTLNPCNFLHGFLGPSETVYPFLGYSGILETEEVDLALQFYLNMEASFQTGIVDELNHEHLSTRNFLQVLSFVSLFIVLEEIQSVHFHPCWELSFR